MKKAAQDIERSCDEIVTDGMSEPERRDYAELLLASAAPVRGFTTCLSAAAGTLRYRLKSIMKPYTRLPGTLLIMAALFICVMCFGMISVSDEKGDISSLVLSGDTKILQVYVPGTYEALPFDPDSLLSEISEIKLEHVAGERRLREGRDEQCIIFSLSDGRFATLTKDYLYLHDYRYVARRVDCYLVRGSVDIEAVLTNIK